MSTTSAPQFQIEYFVDGLKVNQSDGPLPADGSGNCPIDSGVHRSHCISFHSWRAGGRQLEPD